MTISANCKINLGLDILRRRSDGFHDISTIIYPIKGLYDTLDVEPISGVDVEFHSSGLVIDCPVDKNLCVKAARLMQDRYGVGGVSITLDKIVPFGAGLGGGSSDATAVILATNKIYALGLEEEELIALASELGSDTAFFVRNTPQLCSGRGDIMTPVDLDLSPYRIVLIKPDVAVSTAEAYAGVCPKIPATPLAELIKLPIEMWQGRIENGFENHIFKSHPLLAEIKRDMLDAGALYTSMSGSGSTMYGIFTGEVNAEFASRYAAYLL